MFGNIVNAAKRLYEEGKKKVKQFFTPKPLPTPIYRPPMPKPTPTPITPKPIFKPPVPTPRPTPTPTYKPSPTKPVVVSKPSTPSLVSAAQRREPNLIAKVGQTLQKYPTLKYTPSKTQNILTRASDVMGRILTGVAEIPGETVRSVGRVAETIATGARNVPKGKEREYAAETALELFPPTSILFGAFAKPLLKKGATVTGKLILEAQAKRQAEKKAAELATKQVVKQTEKKVVTKVLPKVVEEKPISTVAKTTRQLIEEAQTTRKVTPRATEVIEEKLPPTVKITREAQQQVIPEAKVVGKQEGRIITATAEPSAEAQALKEAKATALTERQAEATARREARARREITTPAEEATQIGKIVRKATTEGIDVAVSKPYEGGLLKQFYNRALSSVKPVIRRQGEAGERMYKLLDDAAREGDIVAGETGTRLKYALKGLSEQEISTFADVVEGKMTAITPRQQEVVNLWRQIADDIATKAETLELSFARRENYYPHFVPEEIISNAKARKDALVRMVQEGQAQSVAEAEARLNQFIRQKVQRRYGHLERPREVDFPIYEKDPRKVLLEYIDSAYHRIADAKYFGKDDSILYRLADEVGIQGGDRELAQRAIDRVMGKEVFGDLERKLATAARGFQTVTKLDPASSVTNLGQSISTMLRTNLQTTARAIGDVLGPNRAQAKMFTEETGTILQSARDEFMRQVGADTNIIRRYIKIIGFNMSEVFNRYVAANAGRRYTQHMADRLLRNNADTISRRELTRLHLDPDTVIRQGGLTHTDELVAGRQVVEDTQFTISPEELPLWWSSPWGKVVTQYKTFNFKQAQFLANHSKRVVEELKMGNVGPLVNSLIVVGISAPLAGEIINDVRAWWRGSPRDDEGLERYVNNVFTTASLGLFADVGTLVTGRFRPAEIIGVVEPERRPQTDPLALLFGPTASDVGAIARGIQSLFADRKTKFGKQEAIARTKPLVRFLMREVPIVGDKLAGIGPWRSEFKQEQEAKKNAKTALNQLEKMRLDNTSQVELDTFFNSLSTDVKKGVNKQIAKEVYEESLKMKKEGVSQQELNTLYSSQSKEVKRIFNDLAKEETGREVGISPSAEVDERVEFVINKQENMRDRGATQEELNKDYRDLKEKGIITDEVDKKIREEQAQPQSRQFVRPAAAQEVEGDIDNWIREALKITGKPSSWFAPLKQKALQESGGQNVPQKIYDVNTQAGTPAFGPMQMIEPTFRANMLAGYEDWKNPIHNIVAAIRYIDSRYGGDVQGVAARGGGY